MGDSVDTDFAAAVGEALAGQMKEQEHAEAQLREQQDEANAQIQTARSALMDAFLSKHKNKGPEYPPPIIEIANLLLQQPRLIQATQLFLQKLVARINEAVSEAVAETLGNDTDETGETQP